MTEQQQRELIKAFMDAWERGDAAGVMQLMRDDSVYSASVGPEPGISYVGRAQLEQGVAKMLDFEAGGESRQGRVWFCAEHAFAEWSYDHVAEDGSILEIKGIDVIQMTRGAIVSIDAYRKCLEPQETR